MALAVLVGLLGKFILSRLLADPCNVDLSTPVKRGHNYLHCVWFSSWFFCAASVLVNMLCYSHSLMLTAVRDIWATPFGRSPFGGHRLDAAVWAPDVWALCCISAVSIFLSHVVIVFHIN